MKSFDTIIDSENNKFHPLMRVWIEITNFTTIGDSSRFHPLMRVWIEIQYIILIEAWELSFHPLMRVWIEIKVLPKPMGV